jgi:predicted alpha/beta hydrolase
MSQTLRETTAATDLTIEARDGYPLAATLYAPAGNNKGRAIVVVGAATAVPRTFYRAFAEDLVARGHPVVTFDYRGIGGSKPRAPQTLRNFPYRNRTWGTVDIASVIDWAVARYPDRALHWVGHSFGGFGFGLADNGHLVRRSLHVATPFSYWGQMDGGEKYRIAALAYAGMPIVGQLVGKLPGKFLGGEDLPKAVMLEWAQWLRSPNMFFDDPTLPETKNFARVTSDMLWLRITDDPWATDAGMRRWQSKFSSATMRVERIRPADAGVKAIGHIPFFKPRFRETLWPRAIAWISPDQP